MDEIKCILFYSKYSPSSKRIMNIISDSELNLASVCIDNSNIRKRIYLSKDISMKAVPCILKIFPDGGVEKFEGSSAFNWVEEVITLITPPQQPVLQQPIPEQPIPEQPIPEQPIPEQPISQHPPELNTESMHTLVEDLDTDEENNNDFSQYQATDSVVSSGINKKVNIMEMAMAMKESRESREPRDPRDKKILN